MKKSIIGYVILTCIIITMLVICVILANRNYVTEPLPPYELNEKDVQEYDISKYTEYDLLKRDLYTYDEYEATVVFDEENMYSVYELTECSLSLGQIVRQGDYLGKTVTNENVLSTENGRIVEMIETEEIGYILTILNSNSFHILIQFPQEYFTSVDYSTVMQGVFVSGEKVDLRVKKITYEISDGTIPIQLVPLEDSFDIFPGTTISVRYNFQKADCEYFINYNAFLIEGKYSYTENTYFEFIVRRYNEETDKYDYTKEFIKTGKKIDNFVGLYYYEDDCTLLVKR